MEKQIEPDNFSEDILEDLEEQVKRELQKCELLSNPKFLNDYERITEVAEELHLTSIIHYREKGHFDYFHRVGVNNINDFLRRLDKKDWEAVRVYGEVLKTLS